MKKRLILFVTVIVIISVAASAIISAVFSINNYLESKSMVLGQDAKIVGTVIYDDYSDGVEKPMSYYADVFSEDTGYRITIIDESGAVLADSQAGNLYTKLDNHGGREEVKEALAAGAGESSRQSATFGKTYLYSAVAVTLLGTTPGDYDDGGGEADGDILKPDDTIVIRIAMQVDRWDIARDQIFGSTIIASLIGIVLAVILVFIYSKRLLKPVRDMEKELEITLSKNEKAENIRKEFVANVTHELKTPLTSISGFVETLMEAEDLDAPTREKFLEIICLEAARLARLIDDILIISDMESGRESISHEDINVNKSINEVIDTLRPLADEKKVDIIFDTEYEMYLGGSADRFKQLILNLLENAVKYSDAGSVVTVNAAKQIEQQKIIISVRDEGIGIEDEDLGRLFERFYRVDKSRSKKVGGTGLGLAIVKHIAILFDAKIKVESRIGRGSTFTVTFPVGQ